MEKDNSRRLYELRKARGLTLEQVADIVGVGKSTVRKWENGMIANMKRDKIALLAKALSVKPSFIIGIGTSDEKENAPEQNELSEGEKVWLSLYNKVGEETREILITLANSVDEMPDESRRLFLSMLRGALGSQEEGQKR